MAHALFTSHLETTFGRKCVISRRGKIGQTEPAIFSSSSITDSHRVGKENHFNRHSEIEQEDDDDGNREDFASN